MATWKKVLTVSDDSSYKNENITLAQLDAGLDGESGYGANKILKVNSSGNAIEWVADSGATALGGLTDVTNDLGASNGGAVIVGDNSSGFVAKVLTGDVTLAANGTTTIGSDKVTYDKMQDIGTANRVLGKASTGTVEEVQVATAMIASDAITSALIADDQINSEHYVAGSIDTSHIADDAVTSNKLANNIDIAGTLDVTSTATFDAGVVVAGDLTVNGDMKTTTVTDLDVEDKTITLAVATYADDASAITVADGSGIRVMTDSGTDATSSDNYASVTWNKDGALTGWEVKDTATTTAYQVAVMSHSTSAGSGDSAGVGSFHFDTNADALYIRVS